MILCEFVKKECNLANFTISNGSSYEEILINFKWLTTKIFGLLSWNLTKRFLVKQRND